jgi:dihydrofolate reductase
MFSKNEAEKCTSGHQMWKWDTTKRHLVFQMTNGTKVFIHIEIIYDGNKDICRKVVVKSSNDDEGEFTCNLGNCLNNIEHFVCMLVNKGFIIGSKDEKNLSKAISHLATSHYRDHYYHTRKGFITTKSGERLVAGEVIYTQTSSPLAKSKFKQKVVEEKSKTAPKEIPDLIVKGDKDTFLQGLKKYVLDTDLALSLVFIIGASGLVNQILKNRRIQNVVLSIVSNAFKGKDTALLLPASIWTSPDYLTTSIATEAALRKYIIDGNILPLIGNDITIRCKHLSETISAFADGRGLNTHFNTKARHFMPLLLSSNISVHDMGNQGEKNGYASRLFEITQKQYTHNAKHAEVITKWVGECHGVASEMFLEYLASITELDTVVEEMFDMYLNDVRTKHPDINGRQQQKIALVLTSGKLLGFALGVAFNLEGICELLAQCVYKTFNEDQKAADVIQEVKQIRHGNQNKLFFFNGKYEIFEPDKHIGIVDGEFLYIRGENIKSHKFTGRSNENLKRVLSAEGFLINGHHDGNLHAISRGFTHRITKIKGNDNTFYAFKIG